MGVALAIVLSVFVIAHLSVACGVARRRSAWRGLVALAIPPLAAWWAWRAGMRLRVLIWTAALGLYAVGVALA
ncbi:MAG: hypothetical protein M3O36_00680 [Myxococcota bacterium]|nr:hypothetical protein [Myxococcota bacterium]